MTGGIEQSRLIPLREIIQPGSRSLLDVVKGNFRVCVFDPRTCNWYKEGPNEFAHLCDAPGTDQNKVVYCGREALLIAPPISEVSEVK